MAMSPKKEYPDVRYINSTDAPGALVAARLYNFPTGSYDIVRQGHRDFLDFEVQPIIRDLQGPWIDLKGYASHLGSDKSNLVLSQNRIKSVKTRISMYSLTINFEEEVFKEQTAYGESVSGGSENSNDPWWRAVDVYVYATKPTKRPRRVPPLPGPPSSPDCPGGKRFSKWAIATPGGFSVPVEPPAVIAGLDPLLSGLDLVDKVHGMDSSAVLSIAKRSRHARKNPPCAITIQYFTVF